MTYGTKIGFIVGEMLITGLGITYGFSLKVYGIFEWVLFDVYVDGDKYLLILEIAWVKLYDKILGSEPRAYLVSKKGTGDRILVRSRLGLTVGKF